VSLKDRILAEEFACGDALPSERQLAIDYGVSRITIVKALDRLVGDDLVVRQHGRGNFVLDVSASTLCDDDCRIAFCVPTPSPTYIFSILLGATRVATSRRVQMQIVEIGQGTQEVDQIRDLIGQGLDGLILYSSSTQTNAFFYQELTDSSFPFVMIDRYCPGIKTDYVGFDNVNAGYRLTEALIQAGHSQIAILTGAEPAVSPSTERLDGYRKALKDYGLPYRPQWVKEDIYQVLDLAPDAPAHPKTMLPKFLENSHKVPTAFVAINGGIARSADDRLSKLQMELLHLVIDADVKNVDYDINLSQAAICHNQLDLNLTPLVAQAISSGEDLGARAVELLLDRMSKSIPETPQQVVLPMRIQTFA
jgi:GntR family transcriptional regulator of arabinose operon